MRSFKAGYVPVNWKLHGHKPMLASANPSYAKALSSHQSRAVASVPSSIKTGGFGRSASSHGVSS